MAVTISGDGTITGITAGGLPNGCVTADDLATTLDLSGNTVTLPSGTGGKVLQVVQNASLTSMLTISTTGTWTDVGDITITPSSTSSKIKITCMVPVLVYGSGGILRGSSRLVRSDGTIVWNTGSYTEHVHVRNADNEHNNMMTFSAVDSPATTSAQTYKVQGYLHTGDFIYFWQADRGFNMICEEIAG